MTRTPGASKELNRIPLPNMPWHPSHVWVNDPDVSTTLYGVQLGYDNEGAFLLSAAEYDLKQQVYATPWTAVRGLSAYIETLPDGTQGRDDTDVLNKLAGLVISDLSQ